MTTTTTVPAELVRRLESLERQNRRMKCGLTTLVLAAGAMVLVAADNAPQFQKTIETEQIVIRDKAGKKRAVLGIDDSDKAIGARAGLYLMDPKEQRTVAVFADENGKGGMHIGEDGKHRIMLQTGADKFAGLMLFANAGKDKEGQIALFYTNDGKPMLFFNDQNHTTRAAIMLDKDRAWKPVLSLQDEQGKSFFSQVQP
jgi:hypothetical protein